MDGALKKMEQRVAKAIGLEIPKEVADLSTDELAELDRRRKRHLGGEGRSYAAEEFIARLSKIGK